MSVELLLIEWWHKALLYFGISTVGLSALIGAAWFFGLLPIIGAAAQVVSSVLSPILGAIIQGIIWTWENVFLPGLWNILSSLVTIVTVSTLMLLLYLYDKANDNIKYNNLQRAYNQCLSFNRSGKKITPLPQRPIQVKPNINRIPKQEPGLFDPLLRLFQ